MSNNSPERISVLTRSLEILAVAAAYYLAARLGLLLAFRYKNVSPVWPPSGVALAALFAWKLRPWPGVFIGAFLANFSTGLPLQTSSLIAVGNTLEGVLCAYLLQRSGSFQSSLSQVKDVLLLTLAAAGSAAIAAFLGVAGLAFDGHISFETFPSACFTWWLGDAMGILVVGLLSLSWLRRSPLDYRFDWIAEKLRAVEIVTLIGALAAVTYFIFFGPGNEYGYSVFPVFIWAALRFGQRGATVTVLIVSGAAILATLHGYGPFVRPQPEQSLIYLQTFMFVATVTTLLMAASIAERKLAEDSQKASEQRFMLALEQSAITVYSQDRDLRYTWIYDGKRRFDLGQVLGKTDADLAPQEDAQKLTEIKRRVIETGIGERQRVTVNTDGKIVEFDLWVEPVRDSSGRVVGVSGAATDITDIGRYQGKIESLNERLRHSMRETHHRVKNNLQVIAAMVEMRLENGAAYVPADELRALAAHTRTLASVHDLLTLDAAGDGPARSVLSSALMDKLIPTLQATALGRKILVDVEDFRLSSKQATSLAIIVCELAVNAVKHGMGMIHILLCQRDGMGILESTDQGEGFPLGFDLETGAGTGLDLVKTLSTWDLGGEIACTNIPSGGARVSICIRPIQLPE